MKRLSLVVTLLFMAILSVARSPYKPAAKLKFGPDGSFKILVLTDTHYISGDERSERALSCVKEMLDTEKPDFVIHDGDIVFGAPAGQGVREIFAPLVERGIPFAVALGNHDGQFDLNRAEVYEEILKIPGCVNRPASEKGITGDSNDVLTLSSSKNPEFVFYLFDSGDIYPMPEEKKKRGYDFIRFDQIQWYRTLSIRFKKANGGEPVPSLAFFHIPLPEMAEMLTHKSTVMYGNSFEKPAPSKINSGLYAQFREMGDVRAVVNGHEHDCDHVICRGPIAMIYSRFSGGNTVYNHLGIEGMSDDKVSGARVFEFHSGDKSFHTWVRLCGGAFQQHLVISPDAITPVGD